jgi:hypothetical protein
MTMPIQRSGAGSSLLAQAARLMYGADAMGEDSGHRGSGGMSGGSGPGGTGPGTGASMAADAMSTGHSMTAHAMHGMANGHYAVPGMTAGAMADGHGMSAGAGLLGAAGNALAPAGGSGPMGVADGAVPILHVLHELSMLLPSLPMLLGHVLAAVIAGWLLRRGDLAVFRLISVSAQGVAEAALVRALRAALALVCALRSGLPDARLLGPRPGRTPATAPLLPQTGALQHTVIRRGPPAAVCALAA